MNRHMLIILNMRLDSLVSKVSAYGLNHRDVIPSAAGNCIYTGCMGPPSPNLILTKHFYFLKSKLDTGLIQATCLHVVT
jgi:hypothetical protein